MVPEPQDWFFPWCRNTLGITDNSLSSRAVTVADRGWPFINLIAPNQSFHAGIIMFYSFMAHIDLEK